MTTILFAVIVLFAALLQTISGFGFALLAMPLATLAFSVAAPGVMGVRIAAPLVAMTGFTLYAVNLLRYRQALQWHAVTRLALAAACGIPLGIWMVATVNETVVKLILAAVLILYALNSLLRPLLTPAPTSLTPTAGRAPAAPSSWPARAFIWPVSWLACWAALTTHPARRSSSMARCRVGRATSSVRSCRRSFSSAAPW
ncbi:MAG: sulfite exporter TauE/SafE family protein [Anaerolineae bacterium]|nr:sulfite exporter TauE/SafE family protein [Anaerolineae bacterium]